MASVWLIEDNEAFSKAALFALKTQGAQHAWKAFVCCEDGLRALKQNERPDLILLDVDLPGMDGIQGIRHFHEVLPDVPIFMLTVFEEDEKIFRAVCAGACGYLLKTESFLNITAAVEQALSGGAPMTPHIARRVLVMFAKEVPGKKDYGLSPREQEVLNLLGEGMPKKQIADKLGVSAHTVSFFARGIYRKLHVNCQIAAVALAVRDGLIKPR